MACTILDDPDYIGLMQSVDGRAAFALFCALLAAAKAQGNNGQFKHTSAVIAAMVRWPVGDFNPALVTLNTETNWVLCDASLVIIRSFKKWNSWGGERNQAGRKPAIKIDSSAPQDERKDDSTGRVPVSVTDSVPEATTNPSSTSLTDDGGKEKDYPPGFTAFWQFYPRKVGKGAAFNVWKRMTRADKEEAIEQAEAYGQAYELAPESRRQFFKHPATWLNARGWEDDHAEWTLLIEGK